MFQTRIMVLRDVGGVVRMMRQQFQEGLKKRGIESQVGRKLPQDGPELYAEP